MGWTPYCDQASPYSLMLFLLLPPAPSLLWYANLRAVLQIQQASGPLHLLIFIYSISVCLFSLLFFRSVFKCHLLAMLSLITPTLAFSLSCFIFFQSTHIALCHAIYLIFKLLTLRLRLLIDGHIPNGYMVASSESSKCIELKNGKYYHHPILQVRNLSVLYALFSL